MQIEEGKLRLRVTLEGPARTVETNYGEREERDTLVSLDLPVTEMAWRFVNDLVAAYGNQTAILVQNTDSEPRE